jgi:hypothetical protein
MCVVVLLFKEANKRQREGGEANRRLLFQERTIRSFFYETESAIFRVLWNNGQVDFKNDENFISQKNLFVI